MSAEIHDNADKTFFQQFACSSHVAARYGGQGVELTLFILRPGQILAPASPVPILSSHPQSTQIRVQAKLLRIGVLYETVGQGGCPRPNLTILQLCLSCQLSMIHTPHSIFTTCDTFNSAY